MTVSILLLDGISMLILKVLELSSSLQAINMAVDNKNVKINIFFMMRPLPIKTIVFLRKR